jgi:hypothetical protein
MSYLTQYAVQRPASVRPARRGARVDARTVLNRPAFDGGANVRVYVETLRTVGSAGADCRRRGSSSASPTA